MDRNLHLYDSVTGEPMANDETGVMSVNPPEKVLTIRPGTKEEYETLKLVVENICQSSHCSFEADELTGLILERLVTLGFGVIPRNSCEVRSHACHVHRS